jgi:hypothetical protein
MLADASVRLGSQNSLAAAAPFNAAAAAEFRTGRIDGALAVWDSMVRSLPVGLLIIFLPSFLPFFLPSFLPS